MSSSKCKCGSSTIIETPHEKDKENFKKLKTRITDLTGLKEISIKPRKYRCQDKKCKNPPFITVEMPIEIIRNLLDTIVDQNDKLADERSPETLPIDVPETVVSNIDLIIEQIENIEEATKELRTLRDKIDSTTVEEIN